MASYTIHELAQWWADQHQCYVLVSIPEEGGTEATRVILTADARPHLSSAEGLEIDAETATRPFIRSDEWSIYALRVDLGLPKLAGRTETRFTYADLIEAWITRHPTVYFLVTCSPDEDFRITGYQSYEAARTQLLASEHDDANVLICCGIGINCTRLVVSLGTLDFGSECPEFIVHSRYPLTKDVPEIYPETYLR